MTPKGWKAYPEYKDSGVEWLPKIPTHWAVRRLKWTVKGCQNGLWGGEPRGAEGDVVCIRVADFDRVRFRALVDRPTVRSIPPEKLQEHLLQPGDLLLEKSGGGDLQPVGAVVLYGATERAVCSNFIARMPVVGGQDPGYLCYVHATLYAQGVNIPSIKQTTGIQNLDSAAYLNEFVPSPCLAEQRAVADFLDGETATIDALIAKKERLIELLQEKRTALISQAVTKGLDPNVPMKESGIEWLGKIPAHWEVGRLKSTVKGCQNGLWGEEPTGSEGDVVCVRVADFDRVRFLVRLDDPTLRWIPPDKAKGRLLQPGDLLLEKSGGGDLHPVGAVVLYDRAEQAVCSNFIARMPVAGRHHSRYLCYLHAALYALGVNIPSIKQTTGIQNLDSAAYLNGPVGLPPSDEQKSIADFLDHETAKMDALIAEVGEAIDRLNEYRTALISAAVTGKIDVREATP